MPAIRPPPEAPTTTTSGLRPSAARSSTISRPAVPCPAITIGSSNGGTSTAPRFSRDVARDRGAVLAVAVVEHDLGAERRGALALGPRRVRRHHDHRRHAEELRRRRHALRVVAGRIGHHAAGAPLLRDRRQLVVGAAELERAGALQRLGLQEHPRAEPRVEHRRGDQRRAQARRPRAARPRHRHRRRWAARSCGCGESAMARTVTPQGGPEQGGSVLPVDCPCARSKSPGLAPGALRHSRPDRVRSISSAPPPGRETAEAVVDAELHQVDVLTDFVGVAHRGRRTEIDVSWCRSGCSCIRP